MGILRNQHSDGLHVEADLLSFRGSRVDEKLAVVFLAMHLASCIRATESSNREAVSGEESRNECQGVGIMFTLFSI